MEVCNLIGPLYCDVSKLAYEGDGVSGMTGILANKCGRTTLIKICFIFTKCAIFLVDIYYLKYMKISFHFFKDGVP